MSERKLREARHYLQVRFPDFHEASLLEARVCAYENIPDGHFIIDQHPQEKMFGWYVAGPGHGFKQGPAIGESVAEFTTHQKIATGPLQAVSILS